MKEQWKDIEGYDDVYQVSNFGMVRSRKNNKHGLRENYKPLKPTVSAFGYHKIRLYSNSKSKQYNIHRLVAECFIKKVQGKKSVLHKDDDRTNNKVDNLYWGDAKDNARDARKNGKMSMGDTHSNMKLTHKQVKEIRRSKKNGFQLSKEYNVTPNSIYDILNGNTYNYV